MPSDGSLFDLHCLRAKTKTTERIILESLFADDCALMVHKESDLQLIVSQFAEGSHFFGLTIRLNKTKVLLQPTLNSTACPTSMCIDGT